MGTASAKEVVIAVEKAAIDAKRHVIRIPITRGYSFPHRVNGVAGGAKVMLRPASEGTGILPLFSEGCGLESARTECQVLTRLKQASLSTLIVRVS